jgi:hypothetical protein
MLGGLRRRYSGVHIRRLRPKRKHMKGAGAHATHLHIALEHGALACEWSSLPGLCVPPHERSACELTVFLIQWMFCGCGWVDRAGGLSSDPANTEDEKVHLVCSAATPSSFISIFIVRFDSSYVRRVGSTSHLCEGRV